MAVWENGDWNPQYYSSSVDERVCAAELLNFRHILASFNSSKMSAIRPSRRRPYVVTIQEVCYTDEVAVFRYWVHKYCDARTYPNESHD